MKKSILVNKFSVLHVVSWLFGVLFFVIGVINTLWGNDLGFGIFIIILSLAYFLPVNRIAQRSIGISIPGMAFIKIAPGIFILFAALGVGDLFDKVDMMMVDFKN